MNQKKKKNTHNRPHKPPLILLKPLQRILRIPRPLHNLPRHIRLLLTPLLPNTLIAHTRVVEDTPDLVTGGGVSGDIELELGALVAGVVCVVGGLVFGGGFGGDSVGLFEDCEGVGGGG